MLNSKNIKLTPRHFEVALSCVPDVGPVIARTLLSYCGSAEKVFQTPLQKLLRAPGIGPKTAAAVMEFDNWKMIDDELKFIEKKKLQLLFVTDENYPQRLKNYSDTPLVLYADGKLNLNAPRMIAIVGTRHATDYGKKWTEKFVEDISSHSPTIVSGLAFGIDIAAHKAALKNNLQNMGVLAHGLDRLYPAAHKSTADKMKEHGGLFTEYVSNTNPDRENFPTRNKIVAAMCDAIIVVESKDKGGALITAKLGNDYNKDVFAVPGRSTDENSRGCNDLIKNNQAMLIESAADFVKQMGWEQSAAKKQIQKPLFVDLDENENMIVTLLLKHDSIHIDEIQFQTSLSSSKLAAVLLGLEMKGVIIGLPGKVYKHS